MLCELHKDDFKSSPHKNSNMYSHSEEITSYVLGYEMILAHFTEECMKMRKRKHRRHRNLFVSPCQNVER